MVVATALDSLNSGMTDKAASPCEQTRPQGGWIAAATSVEPFGPLAALLHAHPFSGESARWCLYQGPW